ncbi:MAG: CDP-diacylglycerol--glycerol-3-phosphate 3-phosphatidyltransferase [Treponemataceae bacterium]|nr:CDP-diacylglycerol--glycerol-3-phosphate 3-phosphatidyltransferase [Treponemataceae bacterium]
MTLANKFTFSRVLLAPVFFIVYFAPSWFGFSEIISVCILLPLLAYMEFTDFLDGYFARKMKEVSDFGKIFDPFGDVLLHMTIFFCFALSGYMPAIILILIFYREFSMLFLRLMAMKSGVAIAARKGGKTKTVLYVVAGFFSLFLECCARCGLVFAEPLNTIFKAVSIGLYVIALIACYVSFIDYILHFKDVLKAKL